MTQVSALGERVETIVDKTIVSSAAVNWKSFQSIESDFLLPEEIRLRFATDHAIERRTRQPGREAKRVVAKLGDGKTRVRRVNDDVHRTCVLGIFETDRVLSNLTERELHLVPLPTFGSGLVRDRQHQSAVRVRVGATTAIDANPRERVGDGVDRD